MYQIGDIKEDKMTYDIAVIGSGSVGSFAGYYAAKMGLKTCLIDKFKHLILKVLIMVIQGFFV